MTKNYLAVFLSPHLDDAVFSCGGEIARLREHGPVCVINIFSHFCDEADGSAVLLSKQRLVEEKNAAEILQYDVRYLNEPEAFFRDRRFKSIANIFKPARTHDLSYTLTLADKLKIELDQIEYDRLYVPMAVGWHIDHWLVLQAVLKLKLKKEIFFYEDAPYCFIENAVSLRLQNFGQASSVPFLKAVRQTTLSFFLSGMMTNSIPKWLYYYSFPVILIYFFRLIRSHRMTHEILAFKNLRPKTHDVAGFWPKKYKAIRQYKSQLQVLFRDEKEILDLYGNHAYNERYWRMED